MVVREGSFIEVELDRVLRKIVRDKDFTINFVGDINWGFDLVLNSVVGERSGYTCSDSTYKDSNNSITVIMDNSD